MNMFSIIWRKSLLLMMYFGILIVIFSLYSLSYFAVDEVIKLHRGSTTFIKLAAVNN